MNQANLAYINDSLLNMLTNSEQLLKQLDPMWLDLSMVEKELLDMLFAHNKKYRAPENITVFHKTSNDYWDLREYRMGQGRYDYTQTIELVKHKDLDDCFQECNHTVNFCFCGSDQGPDACTRCPKDELAQKVIKSSSMAVVANYMVACSPEMTVMLMNYPGQHEGLYREIAKGFLTQLLHYRVLIEQTTKIKESFIYTTEALARAAEAIDFETGYHIQRVSAYSLTLARELGFTKNQLEVLDYSAKMHDVGKIKIVQSILLKPGKLTKEEFMEMENHTIYGVLILGDSPYLKMARDIALSHHEKYDGTGYPYGLVGEAIPLSARIVALADVYDALRSKRPYKPPFDHEKATKIILEGDDRLKPSGFCPRVLSVFESKLAEFKAIYEDMAPDDL